MIAIDLSGKKAIVCGSSQGIGKAAALRLAEAGAEVTLIARDESKLTEVLKELSTSSGQRHSYLIADFTQPLQLKDVIHDHMKEVRSVNILINNTGGPRAGDAVNADTNTTANAPAVGDAHIAQRVVAPLLKRFIFSSKTIQKVCQK